MESTGVPPVYGPDKKRATSGFAKHAPEERILPVQGEPEEMPEDEIDFSDDAPSYTPLTELEQMERELRQLFNMVDQSNQKIQAAAELLKPLQVEPRAVPSAIGLSVDAASAQLGRAELQVGSVASEYHDNVPAGQVITQVPAPGGTLGKGGLVKLIVSKGPPPEKEKYDTLKKQDKQAYAKFRLGNDDGAKPPAKGGVDLPV